MLLQGKCACLLLNSVSIRIYSYVGELCIILLNYEYVGVGTYRCFTVFSVIILVDRDLWFLWQALHDLLFFMSMNVLHNLSSLVIWTWTCTGKNKDTTSFDRQAAMWASLHSGFEIYGCWWNYTYMGVNFKSQGDRRRGGNPKILKIKVLSSIATVICYI